MVVAQLLAVAIIMYPGSHRFLPLHTLGCSQLAIQPLDCQTLNSLVAEVMTILVPIRIREVYQKQQIMLVYDIKRVAL